MRRTTRRTRWRQARQARRRLRARRTTRRSSRSRRRTSRSSRSRRRKRRRRLPSTPRVLGRMAFWVRRRRLLSTTRVLRGMAFWVRRRRLLSTPRVLRRMARSQRESPVPRQVQVDRHRARVALGRSTTRAQSRERLSPRLSWWKGLKGTLGVHPRRRSLLWGHGIAPVPVRYLGDNSPPQEVLPRGKSSTQPPVREKSTAPGPYDRTLRTHPREAQSQSCPPSDRVRKSTPLYDGGLQW
jgi:hypothetical protein